MDRPSGFGRASSAARNAVRSRSSSASNPSTREPALTPALRRRRAASVVVGVFIGPVIGSSAAGEPRPKVERVLTVVLRPVVLDDALQRVAVGHLLVEPGGIRALQPGEQRLEGSLLALAHGGQVRLSRRRAPRSRCRSSTSCSSSPNSLIAAMLGLMHGFRRMASPVPEVRDELLRAPIAHQPGGRQRLRVDGGQGASSSRLATAPTSSVERSQPRVGSRSGPLQPA